MRTVLVTNATQYAGSGTVKVLAATDTRVICHNKSFADEVALRNFQATNPQVICLRSPDPEGLIAEVGELADRLDAVVSNDVYPITKAQIENVSLDDMRRTFEAVFIFPFRLTQLLLPEMKSRGDGCFVFVTSARPLRPTWGEERNAV